MPRDFLMQYTDERGYWIYSAMNESLIIVHLNCSVGVDRTKSQK